ncbi:MAG: hypothetical protein JJU02_06730, partial [Cryomorphaceae bacterium]|nr:hypothetical protein [Cryomorphaceae bacterium]
NPKRMKEDWQEWVGNHWIEGYVVDVNKNPIENVMIVAGYTPQGGNNITTTDTTYTDATGKYRFTQPFFSGAAPGTQIRPKITWAIEGDTAKYFAYQGDEYRVPMVTLNNPDTIREINWTLLPKWPKNYQGTDSIRANTIDFSTAHQGFNIMYSIQDTLNFYIDTTSWGMGGPFAANTLTNTLDSIQQLFGINYTIANQPFPTGPLPTAFRSNPPVPSDYWTGNHRLVGTNLTQGSNFITARSTTLPNEVTIAGSDPVRIRGDPIGVTSGNQRVQIKEIAGRLLNAGPVGNRPSFMNGNANDVTIEDLCYRWNIQRLGINKFRYQYTPGENRSYHHYNLGGGNLKEHTTPF